MHFCICGAIFCRRIVFNLLMSTFVQKGNYHKCFGSIKVRNDLNCINIYYQKLICISEDLPVLFTSCSSYYRNACDRGNPDKYGAKSFTNTKLYIRLIFFFTIGIGEEFS